MPIEPSAGDHVYLPGLDTCGEVMSCDEKWVHISISHGIVALEPNELVIPSEHAKARWRHRVFEDDDHSFDEGEEISRRWQNGVRVARGHGLHGDEVRLDAETGATMIRKENAIATVVAENRRKPSLEDAISRTEVNV